MTSRPSIRTQILIFTLFGEYIAPRGSSAWTVVLLHLMQLLGVTERATRSTLSRMRQRGWLVSTKIGRFSRYSLTQRGSRVVTEGEVRIFEPRRTTWDGRWHMLVYSIPEGKRKVRSQLRQRLGWLGFGRLAPGAWISPNDRLEDLKADLEDLGATEYAEYFSDMRLHFASEVEVVKGCWDLESLNQDYAGFISSYEPDYRSLRRKSNRGMSLNPSESFVQRFWLTLAYLQFPRRDPNLPRALQPEGWLGTKASQLFQDYHSLLKEPSDEFVSAALNTNPLDEVSLEPGQLEPRQ
jgi:phenylacetic acid degradation operon negative regulatory protein